MRRKQWSDSVSRYLEYRACALAERASKIVLQRARELGMIVIHDEIITETPEQLKQLKELHDLLVTQLPLSEGCRRLPVRRYE